ncbi:hypothetical protein D3C81_1452600 [compost metagenome]|jgi:hypothetical protein|uniref:Uncharacterized protein n=1 Tax=Pseudomonas linyingensis TaxID=915471 RepID=A0A1H6ZKJ4_9PSED|nr:hypothetical protein [Pseudomonas linyingensis]MCM2318794.1 hypothetical protein [Pseudomonas sp.]SEJ53911.1 hypothetical protein SAMN05216201_110133 [Pseudomonas linyingensis]
MKTRKLLFLAIVSASTALSPSLLPSGHLPLLAQVDTCQYCPAQLISPAVTLSQLFL